MYMSFLSDTPPKSLSAHSATNSSIRRSLATTGNLATINNNSRSSHPVPEDVLASKKSNAKFQNWLKARERKAGDEGDRIIHHNNRSYDSSNYSNKAKDDQVHYNGDANVLRVSSSRSPEYATPDPGWNSDDETGEITAAQLMSPEDFDAVADDIIARVKGDISMKGGTQKSKAEGNGAKLNSHICPNCEHLMVSVKKKGISCIPDKYFRNFHQCLQILSYIVLSDPWDR